mmetsp:Transcript_17751/g.31064  ORF Transcript_17751/g.31064 Transcript_17751/m.31064 type:complete len:432 (-) Transcript_17751:17-1312(-)
METPRNRQPSIESATVNVGPGSRAVEAVLGEKRLTLRRERFAESLFRNCGLGALGGNFLLANTTASLHRQSEGWDAAGVAAINVGGTSFRSNQKGGSRWPISPAVVDRNKVVENNTKVVLADVSDEKGVKKVHRQSSRRASEPDKQDIIMVDSKVLAAEIDSVAAQLRNLIAGEGTDIGAANPTSGAKAEAQDDEEDDGNGLHARLLRYRYVRKIEAPPPPLEPLEETMGKLVRQTDKIEMNQTPARMHWKKNTQERALHWNQETSERRNTARSRREEAAVVLEEQLYHTWKNKDKAVDRVAAIQNAKVEKLKERTLQREQRIEQVRVRRAEEQELKEQKIKENLSPAVRETIGQGDEITGRPVSRQKDSPGVQAGPEAEDEVAAEKDEEVKEEEEDLAFDFFESLREDEETANVEDATQKVEVPEEEAGS